MPAPEDDASVAGGSEGGARRSQRRDFWKRPAAWVWGIVIAALALSLQGALQSVFDEGLDKVTETGDPVSIDQVMEFRSSAFGNTVAFHRGTTFTTQNLAELNQQQEPTKWLEGRGGVAPHIVFAQVVLTGNRSSMVRITGVEISPDCSEPLDGLLFLSEPAGADDSIIIHFDLDAPNPVALVSTMQGPVEGEAEPYFPARTISLEEGEQQVIVVSASTEEKYCSFFLELIVLDGNETVAQRIALPDGTPFEVTASLPFGQYEAVYLGGVTCRPWVKANDAFFNGDYEHQCDG